MKSVPASRVIVFCVIALAGLAADLATKQWIFNTLGMPGAKIPWWVIDKVAGFQTSLNEGALGGLGQGKTTLFAILSVAAVIGIVWWLFWKGAARQWFLTIALAGVMAGVLGNLYDRVGLPGLRWNYANELHRVGDPVFAVRDWILVMIPLPKIGWWPWPNFNIADSLLVCGAGMLLFQAFWQTEASTGKKTGADPSIALR
jgi:signal peptidase II